MIDEKSLKRITKDEAVLEEAESYIQRIREGDVEADYQLALLLEKLDNPLLQEEVFELVKCTADAGVSPEAALHLAKMFKAGRGCERSIPKAFEYAEMAVKMGSTEAELFLAHLFRYNAKELALYYTEVSANHDHPKGALECAELYDKGLGVRRSENRKRHHEKADYYFNKAGNLGVAGAAFKTTPLGRLIRALRYS